MMNSPQSPTAEGSSKIGKEPLHPYCNVCGWRKGGIDSWDGLKCKCGHSEPPMSTDDPANPAMPLDEARRAIGAMEFPGRIRATDLYEFMTDNEAEDYEDDHLLSCDTSQENDLRLMEEMARRYNAHRLLVNTVLKVQTDMLRTDFPDEQTRCTYVAGYIAATIHKVLEA